MTKNSFINAIIESLIIIACGGITYLFHENYIVNEFEQADYDWDIYFLIDKYHLPLFWGLLFLAYFSRALLLRMKNSLMNLGLMLSAIASCYYTICFANFQYSLEETALGYVDVVTDLGTNLGSYFYDDELPNEYFGWIISAYALLLAYPVFQIIKKGYSNRAAF